MKTNKLRRLAIALFAIAALVAVACEPKNDVKPPSTPAPASSASPAASPAASPSGSPAATNPGKAESLAGHWSGADATSSLNITKKGDKLSVEITGADGMKSFDGTVKGDAIEFTRNGKTESVKAATGAETGVKALEKETNCVVITKGKEAYCRK